MRFYKAQNGFSLYLWLTLFTLFISFFSIILFNYVSSDIRTTKELIRKAKRSSDLKSLILIATNIYRQDYRNSTGNIPYKGKNYQYQIKNIDGS
jgi:CHASE3 domain sensor protein